MNITMRKCTFLIIFLITAFVGLQAQTHFAFTANTGNDMTVGIKTSINPTFDGITLANGDEIGVFSPGGLCVGAAVWNGSNTAIAVHGDNDKTAIADGLTAGEQLYFRIWDASLSQEGAATALYSSGGPNYAIDGIAALSSLAAVASSSSSFLLAYNGNSNTSGSVPTNDVSYLQGATVTVWDNSKSLARSGYSFSGWNTAANGSGTDYAVGTTFTMGTANMVLYAKWTLIPTFTVTYNGNGNTGGSVPTDANNYPQGATVTVLANNSLTKTGYTFAGWNTAADGNGTGYAASATFSMGSANVVLFAKWTLIPTYTVTYDGNGNSGGTAPSDANTYQSGATVTVLGNTGILTKTGYTFAGWNTAADGMGTGYAANATFAMGTSNITLYAHWVQPHSVTYDGNGSTGGTVPTDANTYFPQTTVTVLGNTGILTKTGYTFAGWNTAADGNGTGYAANATFSMGSVSVVLYAKWTLIPTYTVSYDGNGSTGGTVPADANHYLSTATVTVLGNTGNLTKTGYTFAGWNTAADGNGTGYTADATFSLGSVSVVLYAKWTLIPTYVVSYDGNGSSGGTVPADANHYLSGATVTVLGNTGNLAKTGYSFSGWNTAAAGNGAPYAAGATFAMSSTGVVLYAQWTLNTYTLTINKIVGQNAAVKIKDTTVNHGDTVRLSAAVETGCAFFRWRITTGTATLLDSTQNACRAVLTNGNAEIAAVYTYSVSVANPTALAPRTFGLEYAMQTGVITFAVPLRAGVSDIPVHIRLYDLQGRLICAIFDKKVTPGYYSLNPGLQGRMAMGMALCRMEAPEYKKTVKIAIQ